jgi:hypothetical protein
MSKGWLARLGSRDAWSRVRNYLGAGGWNRRDRVDNRAALQYFLSTRASHIAQSSLYGYLKTRAGTRFPELFASDEFVKSINLAKWNIWLACLADLAVYTGGLVAGRSGASQAEVGGLMCAAVDAILADTGIPADASPEFPQLAEGVRARLRACDWATVRDDESPFSESPGALVQWAPVIEEFKRLDGEIVRNSVRFRWQEVRRDLRRDLDAEALIATLRRASPHPAGAADGA